MSTIIDIGITELNEQEITDSFRALKTEVYRLLWEKKRRMATEKIVAYIEEHFKISTIRSDEKSEVYYYQPETGKTIPEGKTLIKELCRKLLEENYTGTLANEVIEKVSADTYVNADDFFNSEPKDLLLVKNGIYDFQNNNLMAFSESHTFFTSIPIVYDPIADCPNFKKHLSLVLPEEMLKTIQEIVGYVFLKENKLEVFFIFLGFGRNGKSKTLETIKRLLGPENCVSLTLTQIETDQYSEALLFNKYANLSGDIGTQILKNTDKIKRLTGRDQITGNRKFLTPISFVNFSKLFFNANELPPTLDTTPGFFSKVIIIDFPYTFVEGPEYESANEKTYLRIKDPEILNKISTPEELSGIFNWGMQGLKRLLQNNDFSVSHALAEIKMTWMRRSDSFTAFCQDCIEEDVEHSIRKGDIRKVYKDYCKYYKLKVAGDKRIKDVLYSVYGVSESKTNDKHFWDGIKFKEGQGRQGFLTLYNFTKMAIDRNSMPNMPEEQLGQLVIDQFKHKTSFPNFFSNYPDMICPIQDFINTFSQDTLDKALLKGDVSEIKEGYLKLNMP